MDKDITNRGAESTRRAFPKRRKITPSPNPAGQHSDSPELPCGYKADNHNRGNDTENAEEPS
jgi:hypothetical protein